MSNSNTKSLGFDETSTNPLVLIDVKTLRVLLGEIVENALQTRSTDSILMKGETVNSETGLMDMDEVTGFLKVSKVTIHNWKKKGVISSHKIGRKLYFKHAELMTAVKRQKYSVNSL